MKSPSRAMTGRCRSSTAEQRRSGAPECLEGRRGGRPCEKSAEAPGREGAAACAGCGPESTSAGSRLRMLLCCWLRAALSAAWTELLRPGDPQGITASLSWPGSRIMKFNLPGAAVRYGPLAAVAALFSALQPVSFYISRCGSFLCGGQRGRSSARCFTFFFLLCFLGGMAVCKATGLCRQPDGAAGAAGSGRSHGLLYFAVILLCRPPRLCAFYRGSLWSGMCFDYDQYCGSYRFDSAMQFPPFPTFVMGILTDTGKEVFGPDNAGMFLYIALLTVVCAAACALSLSVPGRLRVSRIVITALLLFYALFPDSGAGAQTGAGNVLNCGLSLFACTMVYLLRRRIREGAGAERPSGLCLALSSSRS